MKKYLLLSIAIVCALTAGAADGITRSSSRTNSGLKEINRQQHLATARVEKSNAPAAIEAPANAVEVPFTHDLGKAGTDVMNYTSINANNDNRQWQYGKVSGYAACMLPNDEAIETNDDWLFTVPIHLLPGDYVVSFEVGMMGSGATAVEMDVALATAPTVEDATTVISPTTQYTTKEFTKFEHNCNVTVEGYYYLGFHCTTAKTMKGTIKLANVGMRSGSVEPPVVVDPPAAGTLEWTLAPKGELKATIKYTAPTHTKGGVALTEITKVEITSRWGVDKFLYENIAPGEVITVENVEMFQGINNRFTGVAYVGDVAGEMVEHKSIWCGIDTPLTPTNVKLSVNEDDYTKATLTWDPVPEIGENGGYVDPANVTYYIFDAFGSYYDPAIGTTNETSFTLDYSATTAQDFYAYQVTAGNGDLYSLDCASNIITAGTPDALPKTESFKGGLYENMWLGNTAVKGYQDHGTITDEEFGSIFDPTDPDAPKPIASQDGDGGFFFWMPFEKDVAYGIISTRADISKATNPVLEFWYQGQGNIIEVYAGHEVNELDKIQTIDLKANPTTGWTQARISLEAYKAIGAVMFELRFVAAHNDDSHTWSIPIDNIRVRNLDPADARIVTLTGTEQAKPGDPINYTAHIENLGTSAATPTAKWSVNGEVVSTETFPEIAPNGFGDVMFKHTVAYNAPDNLDVTLTIELDNDANISDNSQSATVKVKRPSYATVDDLQANIEGSKVTLTWTQPNNVASLPEVITEDFENEEYTPMSISGAGAWTVFDGDGQMTYNIFREGNNPYQTMPIGFQLFDNVYAMVPDTYAPDAEAFSGQRFMLAPSAAGQNNDNMLISPELSGNAQTITFMAKSFTVAWPETLEVYYSTTDNQPESFTTAVANIVGFDSNGYVPEVWTQFSFDVPAGAKYFAICHRTYDTLALFIDDVTFETPSSIPDDLAIEGYYVFRNGQQVNAEIITDVTYSDEPIAAEQPDGKYEFDYTVVPVYNYGVAQVSNVAKATIEHSGVEDIAVDSNAPAVYYNLQGVRIDESALTTGVYIQVKGNKAEKITVK